MSIETASMSIVTASMGIETASMGIETASMSIETASMGIATASMGIATASMGIATASMGGHPARHRALEGAHEPFADHDDGDPHVGLVEHGADRAALDAADVLAHDRRALLEHRDECDTRAGGDGARAGLVDPAVDGAQRAERHGPAPHLDDERRGGHHGVVAVMVQLVERAEGHDHERGAYHGQGSVMRPGAFSAPSGV